MAQLRYGFEYIKPEDNRQTAETVYEDKKDTKNTKAKQNDSTKKNK